MAQAGERIAVFLDASVLVAAAGSPSGGSSLVLEVCRGRRYRAVVTRRVLREAERNIRGKLPRQALLRFYREIAALNPEVLSPPSPEEVEQYAHLLPPEDAPVLAAAVGAGAAFLLTLDRQHFLSESVTQANLPVETMTPGQFLAHLRKEAEAP